MSSTHAVPEQNEQQRENFLEHEPFYIPCRVQRANVPLLSALHYILDFVGALSRCLSNVDMRMCGYIMRTKKPPAANVSCTPATHLVATAVPVQAANIRQVVFCQVLMFVRNTEAYTLILVFEISDRCACA